MFLLLRCEGKERKEKIPNDPRFPNWAETDCFFLPNRIETDK